MSNSPDTRDNKDKKSLKSSRSTRSLRTTHTNNTYAHNNDDRGSRSFFRSIRNLFLRASLTLSVAAHRLRSLAEEALSSDEVVNELFLVTSSSSLGSSVLEQELSQDQEETSLTTGTNVNGITETMETSDTKSSSVPAWQDFDAVTEALELKSKLPEDEPFTEGRKVWEKRRAAWTACTREDALRAKQRAIESQIPVPRENFPVVYSALVDKNKTLKKPMNLKDALKVINSGWIASKKWERAAQGLA